MGQNFDDYPGFQKIPGMPILLQQSVWLEPARVGLITRDDSDLEICNICTIFDMYSFVFRAEL